MLTMQDDFFSRPTPPTSKPTPPLWESKLKVTGWTKSCYICGIRRHESFSKVGYSHVDSVYSIAICADCCYAYDIGGK